MNPKEMREKGIKLLRDAQAFLLKKDVSAEERAKATQMVTEAGTLEADAVRAEAIDAKIKEYERGHTPPREQPGAGAQGDAVAKENRTKFEKFIRYGTPYQEAAASTSELRDMTTTGTGAQFVPQEFYPVLTEAKKAWGNVIEAVQEKETANGAPMKIAFANDTGNLAHVVGETGSGIVETDPSLSSLISSTDQCSTDFIKVSLAELQDSAFDLDKFIRDQFGKRYFRGLTSLITNGSNSGNIQSLIGEAFAAVTSLYSNAIDYTDITSMWGALDPAYIDSAKWMMKSVTRATLLGVKDGFGRPLYIPNPSTGAFDKLLGLDVVINQYMDEILPSGASPSSSNIPLLLGDFKQGYLLRTVKPGLAIARLNERFMDTLEIGFLGYFRAGGVGTDAGTHPMIALTMNSTGTAPANDN